MGLFGSADSCADDSPTAARSQVLGNNGDGGGHAYRSIFIKIHTDFYLLRERRLSGREGTISLSIYIRANALRSAEVSKLCFDWRLSRVTSSFPNVFHTCDLLAFLGLALKFVLTWIRGYQTPVHLHPNPEVLSSIFTR